ncbi:hypothetical protein [uncultured Hymenobacter sp.]|uniref:hypothetical protein n=1 Tax=uncultured Hymenobacter sp. TaxID=170016 RepID=UPI0035C97191
MLLTAGLSRPAAGQGQPAARPAAGATQPSATNDERRARIWGAAARFIYADDPDLASLRPELEPAMDEGSLSTFASSLTDAVNAEKQQRPRQQSHLQTFQTFYEETRGTTNLPKLLTAIRSKLESNADRMKDPARKQRLDALSAQLSQLATAPSLPPAPAALTLAGPAIGAGLPVAAPAAGTSDTAPQPAPALPAPAPYSDPAPESASSWLPMLSLIMSALSLLGVLYLLLTRARPKSGLGRPAASSGTSRRTIDSNTFSPGQYEELRKEVHRQVLAALPAASQPAVSPPAVVLPPSAPRNVAAPVAAPRAATPAVSPPAPALAAGPTPPLPPSLLELVTAEPAAATTPAPIPQLRTIYVNQQPLDGAFRRDNLADAPASYTIFEITVDAQTPDQGTFVVTRNEAAHSGYIGSHHSILDPACTYNYPQGAVSRIITDVPGTVQRQASGDWHISQKAQIHFA